MAIGGSGSTRDVEFVPILPSFDGFFKAISKGAKEGGERAGKDFADSMAREVKRAEGAVDKASLQVERARERQANATDKTRAAEAKLADVLGKGSASASEIASATANLNRARRSEESTSKATERAVKKLATAEENLAARSRESASAVEDTGGALGGLHDLISPAVSKLGGLASALAGVSAAAGAFTMGKNFAGEVSLVNTQLGYTGAAAEEVGTSIKLALGTGVAGSVEEAAGAVGALNSQFSNLGINGEQTVDELSDNFLGFSKIFEISIEEATQIAGQLVKNGLAGDVEAAADLMTTAMQRVPAQMRSELPEIINEYGVNFKALGFSGEEAFGLLVSQAEKGKWALDKTGDSLKEFTIRGSDMSATSAKAFSAIGLDAEDMADKIATGGAGAREALQLTAQKLLEMPDPAERAVNAVALFGTPLEDLSIDEIPQFLDGLDKTAEAMAGFEGSSQAVADTISSSLQGRLDALRGSVTSLAGDGFMRLWDITENKIIPAAQAAAGWFDRNAGAIAAVAAPVGILVGAYNLLALQQAVTAAGGILSWFSQLSAVTAINTALTNASAGAHAALNLVMNANPIFKVVAALTALAVGLTIFFTKTETGRALWTKFTNFLITSWALVSTNFMQGWNWIRTTVLEPLIAFATGTVMPILATVWTGIKSGWDAFTGALAWAWSTIITPIFNGLLTLAKVTIGVIGTVILAPLLIAWNAFSTALQWAWDTVIRPVWSAMSEFATNTLWPAIQSVLDWVSTRWQALSVTLGVVWAFIRDNVLSPLASWMTETLWPAVQSVLGWIGDRWQRVSDRLGAVAQWVYEHVITRLVDGFNFWWNIFSRVINWVSTRWDQFSRVMQAGWDWIRDNAIAPMQTHLDRAKSWFKTAVDGIGDHWDKLKEKTRKPVEFLVNTVYNNGIRKAWNMVGKLVGLDTLEEIQFASGGILPGYTPGRDPYTFIEPRTGMRIGLSGGEAILRPEATRALGAKAIDAINHAARTGGQRAVTNLMGHYGHVGQFARGGLVSIGNFASGGYIHGAGAGRLSDVTESHAKFVSRFFPGIFTLTSAERYTDNGYHSKMKATDWSNGGDAGTPQMKQLAGAIAKNFPNTAQLIHWPLAGWQNILNGRSFDYGPGTNAEHRNHVHWATEAPIRFDGDDIVLDDAPGGGIFKSLLSIGKKMWDQAIGSIGKFLGVDAGGLFGQLPQAFKESIVGKAWDFLKSKLGLGEPSPTGVGADRWRGYAEEALRRMGYGPEHLDAMIQQIQIESGGDPQAVNNWDSNAAAGIPSGGLLQVIEPTYRDVRARYPEAFEGLPDDRFHPLTNLVAGVAGVKRDWGGPAGRWPTTAGYSRGGIVDLFTRDRGGLIPDGALVRNTSGADELMLPPAVTSALVSVFKLLPGAAESFEKGMAAAKDASKFMAQVTDRDSVESVTARAGLRLGGGFASDVMGVSLMGNIVSWEEQLWNVRNQAIDHAGTIADKERELADARAALAALTRDDAASADDTARANEAVANAEAGLHDARMAQANDLDNVTLISQESIMGLIPMAQGLAGQLTAMGAPTGAVAAGLGQVTSVLSGVASAAGPAGITLGVAVTAATIIFDVIDNIITAFSQARVEIAGAVVGLMGSISQMNQMITKQRASVMGLMLDWINAMISVSAASREMRFAQISGAQASLKANRAVAESQAAFEQSRQTDMNASLALHEDLTLATDRWRWSIRESISAALDDQSAWSDETRARWEEVQAANDGILIAELEAKKANREAVMRHTLALLDLRDVTRNLGTASEKLRNMTAGAFGFDERGATIGTRVAELSKELAEIESKKWDSKTWLNPVNWFNGYYEEADRRQAQIRAEIEELTARPEFQGTGITQTDLRDLQRTAGWSALFGGSESVADMVNWAPIGDAARAADRIEFENSLVDIDAEAGNLRASIERGLAEIENRTEMEAIEYDLRSAELSRDSHLTMADYWRESDTRVRESIDATARYQKDAAEQLKRIAEKPTEFTFVIPAGKTAITVEELESIEKATAEMAEGLSLRLQRVENPIIDGSAVVQSVRGR